MTLPSSLFAQSGVAVRSALECGALHRSSVFNKHALNAPFTQSTLFSLNLASENSSRSCVERIVDTLRAAWHSIKSLFDSLLSSFFFTVHSFFPSLGLKLLAIKEGFFPFFDAKDSVTGFLSNFSSSPLTLYDITFQCAEGAYQAAKFQECPELMCAFSSLDGQASFRKAQELEAQLRQNPEMVKELFGTTFNRWEQACLDRSKQAMLEVVRAKFTQNPSLQSLLLATRDAYLFEYSYHMFWGNGLLGNGYNALGKILMQVRGELGGTEEVVPPEHCQTWIDEQITRRTEEAVQTECGVEEGRIAHLRSIAREREHLIFDDTGQSNFTSFLSNTHPCRIFLKGKPFSSCEQAVASGENLLAALRAKFEQHSHFKTYLLATGSAYLIEKDSKDNALGYLLMQVRRELGGCRQKQPKTYVEWQQLRRAQERKLSFDQDHCKDA